jgi:transposase
VREEASGQGQEALQMGIRLRVCPPYHGGDLLANPADGQRREMFSLALKHFAQGVGAGEEKHILLVVDQAGWHTGGEVEVPKGIELEFLPARSPELMPSERLWPLINERVANRLFEELNDLQEALVERCLSLSEQPESVQGHTLYHWWPDAA